MGDVAFISQLVDTFEASDNLDWRRIYADGMFNGGGPAFLLSCTLAHRTAAVRAVSVAQSGDGVSPRQQISKRTQHGRLHACEPVDIGQG
jgi:poly(3-hydroxybutyrate) depolymerase